MEIGAPTPTCNGSCPESRNGAIVFIVTISNGLSAMDSVSGEIFHAMEAVQRECQHVEIDVYAMTILRNGTKSAMESA